MNDVQIEKIKSGDKGILEEWGSVTSEPDLLGVGAARITSNEWPWQVHVSVMEFIRAEPLESELAAALSAALTAVPGVTKAVREDREQWVIQGAPDGPTLVRAASNVVNRFSMRTRKVLDQLDSVK